MNDEITQHGVFMNITDIGTLITGVSGSGKSELALSLIDRGHQLIADDAPIFACDSKNAIIGRCPDLLSGLLAVRGIGVLNIRRLFGEQAIADKQHLHLIIELKPNLTVDNLLDATQTTKTLFTQAVPMIMLPFPTARNLTILTEAIVYQFKDKKTNINPRYNFIPCTEIESEKESK